MDRRKVLKNMSLSLGFAVSAPTMLSILNSCTSNVATWIPSFFTETEGHMITQLSDIIIPKTAIAGALDVHVPAFMDKMFNEIASESQKETMNEGATAFANTFKNVFGKDASAGSKKEFETVLATYFDVPTDQQKQISEMMNQNKSKLTGKKLNTFLIYKFLTETRRYTLYGYYTSELVGETILSYDPIPGHYEACIPVEDIGNAWSF